MTETSKWRDQWFRELPVDAKLLWGYLCDNCDCAGFWTIDIQLARFETGLPCKRVVAALQALAGGMNQNGNIVWLIRFLEIQKNLPLSESCPVHKPIIARLEAMKDFHPNIHKVLTGNRPVKGNDTLSIGLPNPDSNSKGNSTGKSKSKSKGRVEANTDLMIRIGTWFNRAPTTLWTLEEANALAAIGEPVPEIALVEEFYKAKHLADKDFRRRNIITMLNNWNGEIDKAHRWETEKDQPRGNQYGGKQTAEQRRAEQASKEYEEHIVVPTL